MEKSPLRMKLVKKSFHKSVIILPNNTKLVLADQHYYSLLLIDPKYKFIEFSIN